LGEPLCATTTTPPPRSALLDYYTWPPCQPRAVRTDGIIYNGGVHAHINWISVFFGVAINVINYVRNNDDAGLLHLATCQHRGIRTGGIIAHPAQTQS
jgi:hypothetical protein